MSVGATWELVGGLGGVFWSEFQVFTLERAQTLGFRPNQGQKWTQHSSKQGVTVLTTPVTRRLGFGWARLGAGWGELNRKPTDPNCPPDRPHPTGNEQCPHGVVRVLNLFLAWVCPSA